MCQTILESKGNWQSFEIYVLLFLFFLVLNHSWLQNRSFYWRRFSQVSIWKGECGDEHFLVRSWRFWRRRGVDHDLELIPGDPAILVLVSKVEHLLNILVRHTDWQVPHDVVEVRLNKKGYIS